MKAKICFNNEIHRISNLPETLSALKDIVSSLFKTTLPSTWTLQYIDCEGDKIVIGSENDFSEMKAWGVQGKVGSSMIKIYVEPSQFSSLSAKNQEDDYLVIADDEPAKAEATKVEKLSQSSLSSISSIDFEQEKEEKEKAPVKKEEVPEKKAEEKPVKQNGIEYVGEGKALVDLEVLQKMMENMIQKNLPSVIEITKESLLKEKKAAPANVRRTVHYGVACSGCWCIPIVGTRYKCSVCPNFDFCEDCEATRTHQHNFIKMKERDLLDMFRPNSAYTNTSNNKPKEQEKKNDHYRKYQPHNNKPVGDSNNPRFRAVKEKADKLKQKFPYADFDILLAYVSGCPDDFNMDELIVNFKH